MEDFETDHMTTTFYCSSSPFSAGPAAGTGAAAAAQKDSSLCPIPGCTKPKFVDPNSGVTHDFCGKTHAEEGKRRGIRRKLRSSSSFKVSRLT